MEECAFGIKSIIEISSGFLTPVIAIAVGWITYRQMKITQAEVRHSLYDRRLAVFGEVKKFLSIIARDGAVEANHLLEMRHQTNQAVFLFNDEIVKYIDVLYKRALEFLGSNRKLGGDGRLPVGEERTRVAHENSEHLKWLMDQFDVSRDLFSKYMSFKDF